MFIEILNEHFEKVVGSEVKQDVVLDVLKLTDFEKAQATNAIKAAFPGSTSKRKHSAEGYVTFYTDVACKSFCFPASSVSTSTSSPCVDSSLNESSDILNLRVLISNTSTELESVNAKINDQLSESQISTDNLKTLMTSQQKLQARLTELNNTLTMLFQKEIDHLLQNQFQCETLCAVEKAKLDQELSVSFLEYININLSSKLPSAIQFADMFISLTSSVKENCPLLFSILDALLLHKKDGIKITETRTMSAVHALAILISLKSQKIPNDFKLMFTCLCISFGAGSRFIGMLNHVGLTVSWLTAMNFFDAQKRKLEENIRSITPVDVPILLLMDNINMYRGKRKHLRLFKSMGPTMWNFTPQAVLIANVDGLEKTITIKKRAFLHNNLQLS